MMDIDTSKWSGEGAFTQLVVDRLRTFERVAFIRVEDAPASRADPDYSLISNEIYVRFATADRVETVRRFRIFRSTHVVSEKAMTFFDLEAALTLAPEVGPPDYSDEGMLQYLKTERIVAPYQTRGYKLVELVRIYEVGREPRDGAQGAASDRH